MANGIKFVQGVLSFVWPQGKLAELGASSMVCLCVCVLCTCVCDYVVYGQCGLIRMLPCVCRVCAREIIIPVVNKSEGPEPQWPAHHLREKKKSERERGRGRGREGGSHVVNTYSLRGDWSTANLFTYRLTTQEPLFLPLPSHPPFIPCYLTFPSLASSASRLPSSSPPPAPSSCLFCLFQSCPNPSLLFSHLCFFSYLLPRP